MSKPKNSPMIDQLGPYRIDKQIGRGGMGSVYSGVDEETGEKAAIKVLAVAFADDPGFRSRFLTEIETLKQLRHQNIVRLRGDGEQDGQLFYVMELVEGRSLQEELQAGHHYDWNETAEIAIQICQALKHAHDHGVIHRDLKPANLLRAPDNQIKLTDFGIAKLFGGSHMTAVGSVVGTADFMSPEQAEGLGVTHRSDLYSLGAVMFTLLARRPPFGGASLPQVVHKLRFEEAPSVRRFAPEVPTELEQIISQLLSKKPDERVATALVLANRLRAMKHGLANRNTSDAASAEGDFAKPSVAPAPADEDVTRISNSSQMPNTELLPTAVDDFELREDVQRESGAESWNDTTKATVDEVSEDSGSRGNNSSDGVSSDGVSKSRKTIVETPPPAVNRFTTIEAEEHRRRQETIDRPAKWREAIKVVTMTIVLVAIVTISWVLMRPSADRIYSEIVKSQATGQSDDARKQMKRIEKFLKKFPDDDRAQEVAGYQLDILSEWHASRLRVQARQTILLPVEEKYVQAMKLRESQPAVARGALLNLVRDHESEAAESERTRLCIKYASHQFSLLSDAIGTRRRTSP